MSNHPATAPTDRPLDVPRDRHPEWRDWRWQLQHRIRTVEALSEWITPTEDERQAIEATRSVFRWTVRDMMSTCKIGPK